jgi:hypothetical protein
VDAARRPGTAQWGSNPGTPDYHGTLVRSSQPARSQEATLAVRLDEALPSSSSSRVPGRAALAVWSYPGGRQAVRRDR